MASFSVNVTLVNTTSATLTLITASLDHGEWCNGGRATPPPQMTKNGSWCSESNGLATGTQGLAVYQIGANPSETVAISWDDPAVGTNSYSAVCSTRNFDCTSSGGKGNNAAVTFTLTAPVS
jgi:hypothetical protein